MIASRAVRSGPPDREVADLLVEVAAAAAPPPYRAASAAARPRSAAAEHRAARWLTAATGADDPSSPAALAVLRSGVLGTEDPYAAFADLDPAGIEVLPGWAQWLGRLLSALPGRGAGDVVPAGVRDALTAAMTALAAEWLPVTPVVDRSAITDVVSAWTRGLLASAGPSLDFELRFVNAGELDGSRSGWCERITGLPVLGYVLGTALRQRCVSTAEMLARLTADRATLIDVLFDGRDPGPLVGVSADAGDRHHDGRAVAVLTFASGDRVVYKPRDLRCFAAYFEFVAGLDGAFADGGPSGRRLVVRDGYGWDEYVEAAPCADTTGPRRYVRRLGRLAAITTALGARDLWQDNLLAIGDRPALVDLETVVHPRLAMPERARGSAETAVAVALNQTVLPTGMITAPVLVGGGLPAVDTGSACPALPVRIPYRPNMPRIAALAGTTTATDAPERWRPPRTMAWYGEEVVDPREHVDALVAGYREAEDALAAAAGALAPGGGAADAFRGVPARVMWSSTWTSYSVLRAAIDATVLADVAAREAVLAAPLRRELAGGDPATADAGARLAVAAAEVHDLRLMDIPILYNVIGTDELRTSTDTVVSGLIDEDALTGVGARLSELAGGTGGDRRVAAVLACQQMIDHHTGFTRRPPGGGRTRPAVTSGALVERAARIMDDIWDHAVTVAGVPAWPALCTDPGHDVLMLGPAGLALADGIAGVLVATAEIAAACPDRRWLDRVGRLAAAVADRLATATGGAAGDPFYGPAGVLYALHRAHILTGMAPDRLIELTAGCHARATGDQALAALTLATPRPAVDRRLSWPFAVGRAVARPTARGRVRALLPTSAEVAVLATVRTGGDVATLKDVAAYDPGRPAAWRVARRGRPAWVAADSREQTSDDLLADAELAAAVRTADEYCANDLDRTLATERLTAVAAELVARHQGAGRYLVDRSAPDTYQLSVLDGAPAVALTLLRAAGRGCACVSLLEHLPSPTAGRSITRSKEPSS